MTNEEELEQLYYDRDSAESELQELEDEMRLFEQTHDDYEDLDEWNELDREINDKENWVSYLNAFIRSHEEGYE